MEKTRHPSAWLLLLAGLGILVLAAREGALALLLGAAPGALILAGGVRAVLDPDLHAPRHAALGAALGAILVLPFALAVGGAPGLSFAVLTALGFVGAGWLRISTEPPLDEVPAPPPSIGYAARVGLDDAMIQAMSLAGPPATSAVLRDAVRESQEAHEIFRVKGWLDDPRAYHVGPPPIGKVDSERMRVQGLDVEHVRFESEFEPEAGLPGRERWLAYEKNRTAHAWLVRGVAAAPWLVCVHGFGMGNPGQDFRAFRARELHERRGLNLAFVALPVHGPRAPGRFSGEKFMGVSPLDFVHAETQAIWDLRRLIGWIRSQDATEVGVSGISLGAYTSAILAGIEDGLACVIAGVPPADLISTGEYLSGEVDWLRLRAHGFDPARDRALHSVVSPLAVAPRPDPARRFIYAATCDRFVPVEQVRRLWLHWERPRIAWVTGGHISALMQRASRTFIDEAIEATLAPGEPRSA